VKSESDVDDVICESIKYSVLNHMTVHHQLLIDEFSLYINAFCVNKIKVNSHFTFIISFHLISLINF